MLTRPMRWFAGWGYPHLSEESLVELHALLQTGEHALAARYLRHVKQCTPCGERLANLRADAGDMRRDVLAAVEARITPARLDRQFDVIARRLEGHSGRVLPFPAPLHRSSPPPTQRRWVAVAAACGLLVGVGAGRLLPAVGEPQGPTWRPAAIDAGTGKTLGGTIQQETDEQMLVEIDAALTRSRAKEFRVLDELTPRVANARARGR